MVEENNSDNNVPEEEETEECEYAGLAELFEDSEDNNEDSDDSEDPEDDEPDQIIENVTIIRQPVTLEVETGAEVGAKGEVKPFVKAKITRHLDIDAEESVEVYDILGQDFCELAEQVKIVVSDMKKHLNKGKPEMQ